MRAGREQLLWMPRKMVEIRDYETVRRPCSVFFDRARVMAPADGHVGRMLVAAGNTFARGKPMATLERAP